MYLRQVMFNARNRLAIAIVAAVVVHLTFLLLSHFVIHQNAIPAETNRILTLTLDNTLSEGVVENNEADQLTKNEVTAGQAANVIPRDTQGELVAAQELNAHGAQMKSNTLPAANETMSREQSDDAPIESSSPLGQEQASDLSSTSVASESKADQPKVPSAVQTELVTATEGAVALPGDSGAPDLSLADIVEVTESEQRMLDQKIKHWAENLEQTDTENGAISWQELGQTYSASFSRVPASGDMHMDEVVVEVITEKDGEKLSTTMRMKKLSFSNFGQFVHRWDPEISLHDDVMTGRFHSNSKFNLSHTRSASPQFNDKVTTASYRVNLNGPTSKKNIFLGGLETGVKRIRMPKAKLLMPVRSEPELENTILIDTSSKLTFLASGQLKIEKLKKGSVAEIHDLGTRAMYVIASAKARLHVSGIVNGTVAVYSPRRIVIDGDIVYQSFAPIDEGGDFLGLISGRRIVIPSRRVTGGGNLTIHGALYAGTRFVVTQREGKRAGTLTVHGSVSAGSLSATEPRYATNIIFDKRLENVRPPGFPVTDRYELAAMQQGWSRVVPIEPSDSDHEGVLP